MEGLQIKSLCPSNVDLLVDPFIELEVIKVVKDFFWTKASRSDRFYSAFYQKF